MERCSAAMRFFEPTLDHRAVTALLGREPSYAHLPGERRNRVGKPYPNGMWLLRSEKYVVSADLEDHIGWLLDQVEGVASVHASPLSPEQRSRKGCGLFLGERRQWGSLLSLIFTETHSSARPCSGRHHLLP